jgi:hypothetical protein
VQSFVTVNNLEGQAGKALYLPSDAKIGYIVVGILRWFMAMPACSNIYAGIHLTVLMVSAGVVRSAECLYPSGVTTLKLNPKSPYIKHIPSVILS